MNWTALFYGYFLVAIVLDHAHLACPIALGWSNRSFRQMMLVRWEKFILLPAGLLLLSVWIGWNSDKSFGWVSMQAIRAYIFDPQMYQAILAGRPPNCAFLILTVTYLWWNAWHFGSQHFGIASLLGWRSGPRWLRRAILIIPTMALMLTSLMSAASIIVILMAEIISFLHWITDIVLSTLARRRSLLLILLGAILLVGASGFVWKTLTTDPHLCGIAPACTAVRSIPILLGLRCGLGFWHFLMSRWVWQHSSPIVRELKFGTSF